MKSVIKKKYLNKNVYEATMERIDFIFKNFKKIYISFSGGKDSGLLFNMVMKYVIENNIKIKIGVLFIDLEGFYKITINYVEQMLKQYEEYIDVYWVCLPLSTRSAVSVYQPYWTTWAKENKEIWIRDLPNNHHVITLDNNIFDFYTYAMSFENFVLEFSKWYSKNEQTACLVAIRCDESLNRLRTIANRKKSMFQNKSWSTFITENTYNFYPIYDWKTSDIWVANYKFNFNYNKIYDLFFRAGVPLGSMRICEPFGDDQKTGLYLYKILEPETWLKVVNRVSGANFGNLYSNTKVLGYRSISLPKGFTWKTYTRYLLHTLPKVSKENYLKKFRVYIKYWQENGSALQQDVIEELKSKGYKVEENGISKRGKKDKMQLKFKNIPDNTDDISHVVELLSWKRMAYAIIKNDFNCRTLSFSQTKHQIMKQVESLKKYNNILD